MGFRLFSQNNILKYESSNDSYWEVLSFGDDGHNDDEVLFVFTIL